MSKKEDLFYNWKELVRINIKLSVSYNVLMTVVLLVFGLFVFDATDFSVMNYYKMCEYLMVFSFPILFVGVGDVDCIHHMWELTFSRSFGYIRIYCFRVILLIALGIAINSVPVVFLSINSVEKTSLSLMTGGMIASVWLGLVEILLVELFGNKQFAIGTIVVYYLFESVTKGKITRNMQIMGFCNGNPESKVYLFAASCLMFVVLILCVFFKSRGYYGNKDRGTL